MKKNLNYSEAEPYAHEGKFIKLPEWTGFWFVKNNEMHVFTADGRVLDTPDDLHKERSDWEITDGFRDIGGAFKALKGFESLVKDFYRKGNRDYKVSIEKDGKNSYVILKYKVNAGTEWFPSSEELLAEDYVVATKDVLGL